ncbi:MAG: helix-turn-helix transcriptional regulator [Treponema sp.]|nr:helix-turn-helix transcriptional regulator [Treponema sp.]
MSLTEKIRILLVKRGNTSCVELANRLGMSSPNLYARLKRDNFSRKDLERIASVLDCDLNISFTLRDTGEQV